MGAKYLLLLTLFMVPAEASEISLSDMLCMSYNNYFEDRQHSQEGMEAVSWVVLNRYNDTGGEWPKGICAIIFQPSSNPEKPKKCKFSWTCDGKEHLIEEKKLFDLSWSISYDILSARQHYDPTEGALYYYRCELHGTQGWMDNIRFIKQIGDHCFYGDKL